ncbi:MAG: Peptidase T [Phycisphaerae bacterium]|nr:Peptidase T [Phycisphaerae bacterium]
MDTLLDRFCRYVKMETTANEDSTTYPSSPGQLELGKVLAAELKALGVQDVFITEFGIVHGTVPGNVSGAPTIAWVSHMDTSPEASGKNVKPVIHRGYNGKDIVLPGDKSKVIRVEETPQLAKLIGKTIITSDGTTLLGADDKAGVAVIMSAADYLLAHPEIKHGPIHICFSCDEEIGKGTEHIKPEDLESVVAYTLDGEGHGEIEGETFSADMATVTVQGYNIHPGLATGKMVNAIRILSEFISRLPWMTMAPETTSGRQQFMHPYVLPGGGVDKATVKIILRSFETRDLPKQAELLRKIADSIEAEYPKCKIEINVVKQYRNMREGLEKEPRAMKLAIQAVEKVMGEYRIASIRGGTDGSRLTEMGLPTPNLSTGMHNFHSPLEFACLDEMQLAVNSLVELAQLWGREKGGSRLKIKKAGKPAPVKSKTNPAAKKKRLSAKR